jgi:hypothetical protein
MSTSSNESAETETRQHQLRSFKNLKNHLYGAQVSARADFKRAIQELDHGHHRVSKSLRHNESKSKSQHTPQPETHSQIEERSALKQLHGVVRKSLAERMTYDIQTEKLPDTEHAQDASQQSRKRQRTESLDRNLQKKRHCSSIRDTSSTRTDPVWKPKEVTTELLDDSGNKHLQSGVDDEHGKGKALYAQEEPHKHLKNKTTAKESQGQEELKLPMETVRIDQREPFNDSLYQNSQLERERRHVELRAEMEFQSKEVVTDDDTNDSNRQTEGTNRDSIKDHDKQLEYVERAVAKESSMLLSLPAGQSCLLGTKRAIAKVEEEPGKVEKRQYEILSPCFNRSKPHSTSSPDDLPMKKKGLEQVSVIIDSQKDPKEQGYERQGRRWGIFAPVVPNPECPHTYAEYDNDSVPILHSIHIQHQNHFLLLNTPEVQLKLDALELIERGIKTKDLGRPDVPKKGPPKIIDDCDLYLRKGKIYVATERGLLLAARYFKLAGIPDTTPVRFNGVKPAWAKESVARRYARRIATTTEGPEMLGRYNSHPPVPPGDLGLEIGFVVEVYERHPSDGRAYGRRLDNDKVGWFDYNHTVSLDASYPPWEGLFSPPQSQTTLSSSTFTDAPSGPLTQKKYSLAQPVRPQAASPAPAVARAIQQPTSSTALGGTEMAKVPKATLRDGTKVISVVHNQRTAHDVIKSTGVGKVQPATISETKNRTIEFTDSTEKRNFQNNTVTSVEHDKSMVKASTPSTQEPICARSGGSSKSKKEFVPAHADDADAPVAAAFEEIALVKDKCTAPVQPAKRDIPIEDEVDWDDDPL